jgi:hypothetical protein
MLVKLQLTTRQKSLHERALSLSQQHSNLEFARIENLIEVEANGVHKAFGKKMFIYATDLLGMDAPVAYAYISIARACVKFPVLKKALGQRTLTVSKAARIVSILKPDNVEELILYAQTHSKRDIEAEVVKRNPKAATRDRIRPVSEQHDELKVRLSKAVAEKLKRVQALNPAHDLAGTIEQLIEFYLERKDPVRKAERAYKKETMRNATSGSAKLSTSEPAKHAASEPAKHAATEPAKPAATNPSSKFCPGKKRTPLTAAEVHAVHFRDRAQCTFIEADGRRCNDQRWTEIHHLKPVHLGGANDPNNLTTLCSFHHDMQH